jgi:hypothetical protein
MTEIISNTFNNPSFLPAPTLAAPYNPNSSLLTSLLQFYAEPEHIKQLYLLISSEDKISLRLLEWTVINYAKNESLVINNGTTDRFSVHVSYKATLSGYSKEQFDPCCRTERIGIPYLDKILNTTVAQMNFIRWVINNHILTYIRENYSAIFKDMKHKNKTVKKKDKDKEKEKEALTDGKKTDVKTRKRRSDNVSHTQKNFKVENCNTTLSFSV